ncbi:MAG TPA: hypothetical protein VK206_18305 [Anaerolineales bacterium]|nr:hypothetical protein [Anaerolineales bacterium]
MDDLTTKVNRKPNSVTSLMGGCLAVLYLALCIIAIVFGRQQIANSNAPTPTTTTTPVPQILVRSPADQKSVIHEDFSSNKNDWGLYFDYGKLEIINGKLILQSDVPNGIGLGTSPQISPKSGIYYIQADFSTDIDKVSPYGLVFGLNRSLATYYLFEISPQAAGFQLFKYNAGKWTELIPYSPAKITPYPGATTLSVYFAEGNMELYINGKLVSKYSDKDFFQSKDLGVFVENAGYRLFVDDFFVYDEK